uniref:Chorein N-terminal domain-containing protein n=1 Tax=Guillardia theta TaxID=55529 RepID=A0A7S4JEF6_GUITH|mmetsp:Transcript_15699/g.52547  ORF Transcript_15699/g.52547 Transcript_15699/m.52547 type:complete len:1294 (+) Transcript_15699:284-4165(+)
MAASIVQSIINRYLQKWLKNVTTEQAAIWQGEVIFKNVELRLDVLQEELGLPVVFTRGFIQELRVYLPLASLLRDNIKFTLSNVEVVARTPTGPVSVSRSPQKSPKLDPSKTKSTDQCEGPESQGWMQSMLSRIMQNINVDIRNLVFKYCTDEYVSSISWKSLSVKSTNMRWQPAFADPDGETQSYFKVINLEHATWCLDAVDERGNVVYGDPLFNRESVQVRIVHRINPDGSPTRSSPLHLPSLQVDIRLEQFLLNVCDSKVAMLCMLFHEVISMVTAIHKEKKRVKMGEDAMHGKKTPVNPHVHAAVSQAEEGAERRAPAALSDEQEEGRIEQGKGQGDMTVEALSQPSGKRGWFGYASSIFSFGDSYDSEDDPEGCEGEDGVGDPSSSPPRVAVASIIGFTVGKIGVVLSRNVPEGRADFLRLCSSGITMLIRQQRCDSFLSSRMIARRFVKDFRLSVVSLLLSATSMENRWEPIVQFGRDLSSAIFRPSSRPSKQATMSGKEVEGSQHIWSDLPENLQEFHTPAALFPSRFRCSSLKGPRKTKYVEEGDIEVDNEELSEELQRTFRSPLSREGDRANGSSLPSASLFDELMSSNGSALASTLMRRARGEDVELSISQSSQDGWKHDDSSCILAAFTFSKKSTMPSLERDRGKQERFDPNSFRSADSPSEDGIWLKLHMQPLNARVSPHALDNIHKFCKLILYERSNSIAHNIRSYFSKDDNLHSSGMAAPYSSPPPPPPRPAVLREVYLDLHIKGVSLAVYPDHSREDLEMKFIPALMMSFDNFIIQNIERTSEQQNPASQPPPPAPPAPPAPAPPTFFFGRLQGLQMNLLSREQRTGALLLLQSFVQQELSMEMNGVFESGTGLARVQDSMDLGSLRLEANMKDMRMKMSIEELNCLTWILSSVMRVEQVKNSLSLSQAFLSKSARAPQNAHAGPSAPAPVPPALGALSGAPEQEQVHYSLASLRFFFSASAEEVRMQFASGLCSIKSPSFSLECPGELAVPSQPEKFSLFLDWTVLGAEGEDNESSRAGGTAARSSSKGGRVRRSLKFLKDFMHRQMKFHTHLAMFSVQGSVAPFLPLLQLLKRKPKREDPAVPNTRQVQSQEERRRQERSVRPDVKMLNHLQEANMRITELQEENELLRDQMLQATMRLKQASRKPVPAASTSEGAGRELGEHVVVDMQDLPTDFAAARQGGNMVSSMGGKSNQHCRHCERMQHVERDNCESLLVEASGLRRALLSLIRNIGISLFRIRRDLRSPWPIVLILAMYAGALHIFIAYLLHDVAVRTTT